MSYICVTNIHIMAKYQLFSDELQQTALIFKALGNPARLAILQYISKSDVCISGDISKELPLSRTTITQHLTELKEIGIITGEISGTKVNYCINTEVLNQVRPLLDQFLSNLSCCGTKC